MNAPLQITAPDKDKILDTLRIMFEPDAIIELQAKWKESGKISVGYFDQKHWEQLANAAVNCNHAGALIDVALNKIDPKLLSRSPNCMQELAITTTDHDIVRLNWIQLAFEPIRTNGNNSTKKQINLAQAKLRTVANYLEAQGWPLPNVGMSGNESQLLYPIDLPNNNTSCELIKSVSSGLAAKFDDRTVRINQNIFNARGLIILFGTVSYQGKPTPLGPYRLSALRHGADKNQVVTPEQLTALITMLSPVSNTTLNTNLLSNAASKPKLKNTFYEKNDQTKVQNPHLTQETLLHQALLTIVTSNVQATKRFYLDQQGSLKKESAVAINSGTVKVKAADTPNQLVEIIKSLSQKQALIFGIPRIGFQAKLATKKMAQSKAETLNIIARTREDFLWHDGPGWMMLDYDPAPVSPPLTQQQLLDCLYEAAPMLRDAPAVWNVSASSDIWDAQTKQQLQGITGQRLYILVANARDIPRAGKVLFHRLWLAGHGYFVISSSGQILERAPIDASVWQAERLDFAAPPICDAPLQTRRPNPLTFNNQANPLNSILAFPDLSPNEHNALSEIKKVKRNQPDLIAESKDKAEKWVNQRIQDLSGGAAEVRKKNLYEALTNKQLYGDFELTHSSGRKVTVNELLSNRDQWHGECFHDPLEPEYSNSDPRIAKVNLKSGCQPYIWSFAHGGCNYGLNYNSEILVIQQGNKPAIIDTILKRLRMNADIYERGSVLARLIDNELIKVEESWLRTYIEKNFALKQLGRDGKSLFNSDCPKDIPSRILQARGEWGLPSVTGIVTYPVIRPDLTILSSPGYDVSTGLLHVADGKELQPRVLTDSELVAALQRIWEPFQYFSFESDLDRGIYFSALLTTICRPTLETAPAFLIRAHSAGNGKTLLSSCLMILVGAPDAALPLQTNNQDEIEKRLFSILMRAKTGVMLDNLSGVIDSPAMCAFLTSPSPSGRILGKSEVLDIPNRTLWILNGNNVTPGGDTYRRILPCSLDANNETPETIRYPFCPKNKIRNRLAEYREDLLSVFLTYHAAGSPRLGKGSFGSFEIWDSIIRQCVCWLINKKVLPVGIADPLGIIKLNRQEDPDRELLGKLLIAWFEHLGNKIVYTKDLFLITQGAFSGPIDKNIKSIQALQEALTEVASSCKASDTNSLGHWLRNRKGQIVDGLRIDSTEKTRNGVGWKVSCVRKN